MEAFALTGRNYHLYIIYPQGVALGSELLPFQGVWSLLAKFSK